jgi:hypothetical protein
MLRKAEEWGYVESNPAIGIKQGRERIVEQDFLSSDEVARLLDACNDRIRSLVTCDSAVSNLHKLPDSLWTADVDRLSNMVELAFHSFTCNYISW